VRQVLHALNSVERAALKKLLPKGIATAVPEEPAGTRYPSALLSQLADVAPGEQYSIAGFITEDLLHYAPVGITAAQLCATASERCPELTETHLKKITASKTTEPYLNHIRETRKKVRFAAIGDLQYDQVVGAVNVEGHPDIRTVTQIFEVKMTGQLKQNWVDFLLQVFAYAALDLTVTDIYLVLPLQEILWHQDVANAWPNRAAYREALETAGIKKRADSGTRVAALLLLQAHLIGSHMSKLKLLTDTVNSLPLDRPSQIFLSGPTTTRMTLNDADLAGAAAAMAGRRVFIHSQYLINLCAPPGSSDDYHTALLMKNLEAGVKMGARGVVVHVGKSTSQPLETALINMKANIQRALAAATPACPLLLETPAGQGTETLTDWDAFAAFVADINDPRLRVCVDTCHVFATGADPHDYIRRFQTTHPGMTKLIHFNDSATPCGSCRDVHAFCGEGHIGLAKMTEVATAATAANIPMLVE
jgi:deoxyribonuclease-4